MSGQLGMSYTLKYTSLKYTSFTPATPSPASLEGALAPASSHLSQAGQCSVTLPPIPTKQRALEGASGVFLDLWPLYLFVLIFKNAFERDKKKKKGTTTLLIPGGLAVISA